MFILFALLLLCISFIILYNLNKVDVYYQADVTIPNTVKKLSELKPLLKTYPVADDMANHWKNTPLPKEPPLLGTDFILPSPYLDTKCKCIEDPDNVEPLKILRKPVNDCIRYLSNLSDAFIWSTYLVDDNTIISYINKLLDKNPLSKTSTQGIVDRMTRFHIPIVLIALRCSKPLSSSSLKWITTTLEQHKQVLINRKNNLKVWLILDLTLTSMLLNDLNMIQDANNGWKEVLSMIDDDGTLKSEDMRDIKQADYYDYFCEALVVIGFLLKKTDVKVTKLATKTIELNQPNITDMYWLYIYNKMYTPDIETATVKLIENNINSRFLGGHITMFS